MERVNPALDVCLDVASCGLCELGGGWLWMFVRAFDEAAKL
jgi:hypothetical protein